MMRHFALATLATVALVLTSPALALDVDSDVAAGDWEDPNSWSPVGVPTTNDNVTIKKDHVITINGLATNRINSLTIAKDGTLTHTANGGTPAHKIILEIADFFTLEEGGLIDLDGRGYGSGGPGYPGSHGGRADKSSGIGGPTYGSITAPTTLGSASLTTDGGGAACLAVGGLATIDGVIRANGVYNNDVNQNGSGGGSVWISAGSLAGTGTITVQGGRGVGGGGGGGRIAIVLTNSASFGTVAFVADGGVSSRPGAAGTIYLESTDHAAGLGELIVDNTSNTVVDVLVETGLNGVEAVSYEFSAITLTNGGLLAIGSDDTLVITNTVMRADATNTTDGIRIRGGTLTALPALTVTNYYIEVAESNSTFDPVTALTVGTNGALLIDKPHAFSGDLVIDAGGMLTHAANTTVEANKCALTIGGSLTIHSNGAMDVSARGFRVNSGPGRGSHGGRGTIARGSLTTYGSIHEPVTLGSGGTPDVGRNGGGAVWLDVAGDATVDGTISANGASIGANVWALDGGGGSIYLRTATLAGNGVIEAIGGAGSGGGGGGGRIAIVLTNSASFGNVALHAYGGDGGNGDGAAGTVYLRTSTQATNEGTLIIDNGVVPATDYTEISALVTDAVVGDVEIRNTARFQLNSDQRILVYGSWSNRAVFLAQPQSVVEFMGTNDAVLYGDSTFTSLVCTNLAKTIRFEAGSLTTVDEFITLAGSPPGTNMLLRSLTDNVSWQLSLDIATVQEMTRIDVKDSDASPDTTAVGLFAIDSGGNTNWVFTIPGLTNTWIGTSNTLWNENANWDQGRIPIAADDKTVIGPGPFQPVLPSSQELNKLDILSGAWLQLAGYNLTVEHEFNLAGALIASINETVELRGDVDLTGGSFTQATTTVRLAAPGAQSVTSAGNQYHALTLTNAGRVVTFTDTVDTEWFLSESVSITNASDVTAGEFRLNSGEGTVTQTVAAGATATIRDLMLFGGSNDAVVLRSSLPASAWNLNVTRSSTVRDTDVQDGNADSGRTVYPVSSIDSGGNSNWVFGSNWKVWNGSVDADFANTNNWTPTGLVNYASRVLIDGNYANAPLVSAAASVRYVALGGENDASTLTIDDTFTVGEDIVVYGNGTWSANRPSVVSNDVVVINGGRITHDANTTTEDNKLALDVGGNLHVDAEADINVDRMGFSGNAGPGRGSHGGRGNIARGSGPTYDSVVQPIRLGAGGTPEGGRKGGGAVRLEVVGACNINGTIRANGGSAGGNVWALDGGGGSIYIEAATLAGDGRIQADGGVGSGGGGGGGGRVAVVLTGGSDFGNVRMQAFGGNGGNGHGAAGTVYKSAQGVEEIISSNQVDGTPASLELPPSYTGSNPSYPFPDWAFNDSLNNASLQVSAQQAMTLITNLQLRSFTLDSTSESLDLRDATDLMKVQQMTVNGTLYTKAGLYTVADWNGFATPANVTGSGAIFIGFTGTILFVR